MLEGAAEEKSGRSSSTVFNLCKLDERLFGAGGFCVAKLGRDSVRRLRVAERDDDYIIHLVGSDSSKADLIEGLTLYKSYTAHIVQGLIKCRG